MKLGIARERLDGERRVAATPETVTQLAGLGLDVVVESGAGGAAGHSDEDYRQAGALIVPDLDLARLDVYAHVRPLEPTTAAALRRGDSVAPLALPNSAIPISDLLP